MDTHEHLLTRIENLQKFRAALNDPLGSRMLLSLIEALQELAEERSQSAEPKIATIRPERRRNTVPMARTTAPVRSKVIARIPAECRAAKRSAR